MRRRLEVPILSHEQIGDCEYEMTLASAEIASEARAGQFLQILYDDSLSPFTRRPFSVFTVDPERGVFSIVYLARGVFTQGMRSKRAGETLSVVGPLGNRFVADPDQGTRHLLVAGGVGAPPLYLLAWEMLRDGVDSERLVVINGGRTRSLLVGMREFGALGVRVLVTTNDGSCGIQGLVTDALIAELAANPGRSHVYTCGPTAMLRAVSDVCVPRGVPCQVSVETVMPCGLGVCMGCIVKIRDPQSELGYQALRSCYEGPVFRAEDVIW